MEKVGSIVMSENVNHTADNAWVLKKKLCLSLTGKKKKLTEGNKLKN